MQYIIGHFLEACKRYSLTRTGFKTSKQGAQLHAATDFLLLSAVILEKVKSFAGLEQVKYIVLTFKCKWKLFVLGDFLWMLQ